MDPLEDVLALLRTRGHVSSGLTAGGDWAVRFPAPRGVKFNAVERGSCELLVPDEDLCVELGEGDCFLLTRPLPFVLRGGPDVPPVDASEVFADADDGFARTGTGDEVVLIGGGFTFGERARVLLLDALPAILHVPASAPQSETLRWALAQIARELSHRPPAATLVGEHLAVVMLVHALRIHLAQTTRHAPGWLAGLADPIVGPALSALHAAPHRPWTVAEIAEVSGVSRSTLAERFKRSVGLSPLDYLRRWRIELASHRLRHSTDTLAVIARSVGYRSESALSTAFKQVTGVSPRVYRSGAAA
ncbi:AraC family transcriptional regulator [Streptomyces justiciae]|uniref:AraC family transcriptional regulator n=1 Tax=Streptomyces justiciae TaxID=2780140 RepID=UPI00187EEA72|nr:AraC family transcriptional regulator [Streptomyces justiciae]MBE8477437.1 AraC family transcriptional regulator [Streptomyces justiciae]